MGNISSHLVGSLLHFRHKRGMRNGRAEGADGLLYGRAVGGSLVERFGLNRIEAETVAKILFEASCEDIPNLEDIKAVTLDQAVRSHQDDWYFENIERKVGEHEVLFLETSYVISAPSEDKIRKAGEVVTSGRLYRLVVFYNCPDNETQEFARAFGGYIRNMVEGTVLRVREEFGVRRFRPYDGVAVKVVDKLDLGKEFSNTPPKSLTVIGLKNHHFSFDSVHDGKLYAVNVKEYKELIRDR